MNQYEEKCHALKVPTRDIDEVLDLTKRLKGEDAVDLAIQTVDCPSVATAEEMLKAVTRFFSNVRYLCSQIERLLDGEEVQP